MLTSLIVLLASQEFVLDRRLVEARQALAAGEFVRAEKLSRGVLQAQDPRTSTLHAMQVFAEASFRLGAYKDAYTNFKESVRVNSDRRWNVMTAISGHKLGLPGSGIPLDLTESDLVKLKSLNIDLKSIPAWKSGDIDSGLGRGWFLLSTIDKGQLSFDAANEAERHVKGNVAIDWMQGLRSFELGQYKNSIAEFEHVSDSEFKSMAERAKIYIRDAKLQLRLRDGGKAIR